MQLRDFRTVRNIAPLLLLLAVGCPVPFIEGDWELGEGEEYGFTIGSTRAECLEVALLAYPQDAIRVVWSLSAPYAKSLREFENTEAATYSHRTHGEFRQRIENVPVESPLIPPLRYPSRWDIELPSGWVNSIHLYFEDDRLSRIGRSRWLFERP